MNADDLFGIINETETPIFLNKEVFEMSYLPEMDIYKYRDRQLTMMATHSSAIKHGLSPQNLLLTGGYATGKTTTLKQFLKMLADRFSNVVPVYINCKLHRTEHQIYGILYQTLLGTKQETTGKSNEFLFRKVTEHIVENDIILVVAFDDFDSFKNRDELNKLLYKLLRIHEMVDNIQISVFTVSNQRNYLIDPDVQTVFNRIAVPFDQYNLEQMYNILADRCTYGFYQGVISDDLIKEVARKSYNKGDLRYGIRLLSRAGERAESAGTKILKEYL